MIYPGTCRAGSNLPSITRRRLLISGMAGAAGNVLSRFSCASAAIVVPKAAANRRFLALYAGEGIGSHTITYSAATGETRITTEIGLVVKALFFTLFAYSHRSEEIWRDRTLKACTGGHSAQERGSCSQ